MWAKQGVENKGADHFLAVCIAALYPNSIPPHASTVHLLTYGTPKSPSGRICHDEYMETELCLETPRSCTLNPAQTSLLMYIHLGFHLPTVKGAAKGTEMFLLLVYICPHGASCICF